MSAFKGTPGPWESVGGYVRTPLDTRGGGWMIADCRDYSLMWDEIYANAALIAAAPELLSELMNANAQMQMAADCIEAGRYDEAILHVRSLSRGRLAAIAKATGEQA